MSCLVFQITHATTLSTQIDSLINEKLPHASIGILIKDPETDQTIYSKNSELMLSPASGIKLFTATAALYHLKPNYRFLTTLSKKNQDYYIGFSGSPSLTIDNLNTLLMNLVKRGERTIEGNIVVDASRFKAPYYAGGVSYDDLGWYFTAPDTTVILNENAMTYEFSTAKKLGGRVRVKPALPNQSLHLINQLTTVSPEEAKNHCNLNIEIKPNNTLRLYGCMAKSNEPKKFQLAVPDPILLAKQIIMGFLKKNMISMKGQILRGRIPTGTKLIASLHSSELNHLITHMLQESDNLYASSLTKQLAYSLTSEGTNKQGAFAIKKILAEHTHLDMNQIDLYDGIGTRYNLVTPQQMVTLLTDIYHDESMYPIIKQSLPVSGVAGTLKDRFKKTKLEKKVYAKTGTMHDISSLSGYLVDRNNKTLVFSIIINGINKPIHIAKELEDKILLSLVGEQRSENK